MEPAVRTARRIAMFAVACASGASGLLMIWILLRPGVISRVATVEMLVVLGLFLLPVATLAAWFFEQRAIAEEPVREAETAPGVEHAAGSERSRAVAHVPGRHEHADRAGGDHRRAVPARRHRKPAEVGDRA